MSASLGSRWATSPWTALSSTSAAPSSAPSPTLTPPLGRPSPIRGGPSTKTEWWYSTHAVVDLDIEVARVEATKLLEWGPSTKTFDYCTTNLKLSGASAPIYPSLGPPLRVVISM